MDNTWFIYYLFLMLIILYLPWKRRKRYAAKRIMKNRGVFEKKHKNSADILTAIWPMRSSKFGLENVQCNYYNRDRFHYKRIQTQKPDADNDF